MQRSFNRIRVFGQHESDPKQHLNRFTSFAGLAGVPNTYANRSRYATTSVAIARI